METEMIMSFQKLTQTTLNVPTLNTKKASPSHRTLSRERPVVRAVVLEDSRDKSIGEISQSYFVFSNKMNHTDIYSSCLIQPDPYFRNITITTDSVSHFTIINGVAAPFTVIINLLLLWTILSDKDLRTVNYNILLAALAVTDLLVGLIVEPLFSAVQACLVVKCSTPCIFTGYFMISILCASSTLIVLTMGSLERYLAIEHNQFYLENVTTKRIVSIMVILCVFLPTGVIICRILTNGHILWFRVPIVVCLSVLVLVIIYCSIRVQTTACRHRRAINAHTVAAQQMTDNEEQQRRRETREEFKKAFTSSLIVFSFILLYCPLIAVTIIRETVVDKHQLASVYGLSATFLHLHSLVNPIIVSLRLSYIREAVKKKLCCRNPPASDAVIALR